MTDLTWRLRRWWTRTWRMVTALLVVRPWLLAGIVSEGDEVPDRIPVRRAFLVGIPPNWKWLVFDCPCRTGHRIMLNLDRGRRPHWTIQVSRLRRITVSPSIDYRGSNRSCHYFIRDGRVVWARGPRRLNGLFNFTEDDISNERHDRSTRGDARDSDPGHRALAGTFPPRGHAADGAFSPQAAHSGPRGAHTASAPVLCERGWLNHAGGCTSSGGVASESRARSERLASARFSRRRRGRGGEAAVHAEGDRVASGFATIWNPRDRRTQQSEERGYADGARCRQGLDERHFGVGSH